MLAKEKRLVKAKRYLVKYNILQTLSYNKLALFRTDRQKLIQLES